MFRFTIREILLLTATAGIGTAWWLDHSRQASVIEAWKGKAATVENRVTVLEMVLEDDSWKLSWINEGKLPEKLKAVKGESTIEARYLGTRSP